MGPFQLKVYVMLQKFFVNEHTGGNGINAKLLFGKANADLVSCS